MRLHLAYGQEGLEVELPGDGVVIIEPTFVPGLPNEAEALHRALRQPIGAPPLRELAGPRDRVAIVFSDLTRPAPNRRLLPPLLSELEAASVRRENILLINALGLHRPNTPTELAEMLGREVVGRYKVVNHAPEDREGLALVGRNRFGGQLWLSREYLEAPVRIVTGFIEPHLFAGFSGGPKGVLPGVAGAETIMHNHRAAMLDHPQATWGITAGNPVWEEMSEAASLAPPTFILNVTLNKNKEITGVFAGDWRLAHQAGCAFARQSAMQPVPQPCDIVLTTNSGYPLDLNLYQAVKGISAAASIVKEGGAIVAAAECREGVGHGDFAHLLREYASPESLLAALRAPGFWRRDQWQAHILAKVRQKCQVYLYSPHISPEEVPEAYLRRCASVEEAVAALRREYGPGAKVGVLPQGPLTIPYLA